MTLIIAIIAGAGVLAAAVPAHRALRTDPVTVLRSE
jgi:ABC-type antimicrobial peptide transport system permease subunit